MSTGETSEGRGSWNLKETEVVQGEFQMRKKADLRVALGERTFERSGEAPKAEELTLEKLVSGSCAWHEHCCGGLWCGGWEHGLWARSPPGGYAGKLPSLLCHGKKVIPHFGGFKHLIHKLPYICAFLSVSGLTYPRPLNPSPELVLFRFNLPFWKLVVPVLQWNFLTSW